MLLGAILPASASFDGVLSPASVGIALTWIAGIVVFNRVRKNPEARVSQAPGDLLPAQALAVQLLADLDFLHDLLPLIAILSSRRSRRARESISGHVQG